MEEERQREVAYRLRALRGPKPQPVVANELDVTLRAYQRWEAGGGINWENLQKIASLYDVSENFLLYGTEEARGPQSALERIETKLDELLLRLPAATALPQPPDALLRTPASAAPSPARAKRPRTRRAAGSR
jgi:hypothetical protein